MARAKNTARAEARRRTRASRAATFTSDDEVAIEAEPVLVDEPKRPRFALPDVIGDIRAFPRMFVERKLLWLPFIIVVAVTLIGLAANAGLLGGATDAAIFLVQLVLQPPALILFFIGGFLAPRGSYLVGGLLGAISGPLFAVWYVNALAWARFRPDLLPGTTTPTLGELVPFLALQGALYGILAGGFAAWYRRFLRTSQERARINRIAREQEQRLKAREQERRDREAAREARKTTAQKPTS